VKNVRLEAWILEVPLKEPFTISAGTNTVSRNVVVRLSTRDGLEGWGEASPSKRVLGETVETVVETLRRAAGDGAEVDYTSTERIYEYVWGLGGAPSAMAALDMALLDLYAKERGEPLWRLLGGYRESVETDITISLLPPEEQAKRALRYVEEGFKALKLKLGRGGPEEDIARVKAVRDAVGEGVRILVDANQGWSLEEAKRVIERISGLGVELVEQPVAWDDLDAMAELARWSPVPIAADESVKTPADALRVAERGAAQVINIKLMKSRGILGAARIAAISEAAGIVNMIGCMGESRVGITAGVHAAQALRNIRIYDLDADLLQADCVFPGMGAPAERGVRRAPGEPGLGRFKPNPRYMRRVI